MPQTRCNLLPRSTWAGFGSFAAQYVGLHSSFAQLDNFVMADTQSDGFDSYLAHVDECFVWPSSQCVAFGSQCVGFGSQCVGFGSQYVGFGIETVLPGWFSENCF